MGRKEDWDSHWQDGTGDVFLTSIILTEPCSPDQGYALVGRCEGRAPGFDGFALVFGRTFSLPLLNMRGVHFA